MHGRIRERARVYTAAAGGWGNREVEAKGRDVCGAVGNGLTITANGSWGSIEDGRLPWILP